MIRPLFVITGSETTDRNFQELRRLLADLYTGASAKETQAVLAAGDNSITPTVPAPKGRIITFQSAAANLFDKGMVNGRWVINASAPCTIRLAFF